MRQAITTKFIGPTDHRCSRVKAKASAGTLTFNWDYACNVNENHAKAARALAAKLGWTGNWVAGGLPSEDGNVYVYTGRPTDGPLVSEDGFTIHLE